MERSQKTKGEAMLADSDIAGELAQLRRDLTDISHSISELAAAQAKSAATTMQKRFVDASDKVRQEAYEGGSRARNYASERFDATLGSLSDRNAAVLRGVLTGTMAIAIVALLAGLLRPRR